MLFLPCIVQQNKLKKLFLPRNLMQARPNIVVPPDPLEVKRSMLLASFRAGMAVKWVLTPSKSRSRCRICLRHKYEVRTSMTMNYCVWDRTRQAHFPSIMIIRKTVNKLSSGRNKGARSLFDMFSLKEHRSKLHRAE